mmetsp:Transcript_14537/g.36901  ORF Transcript_14537/g.36901 Transcript_14537/m.36901 type:complete len:352 (-) Transcript_14537:893-1948(-)
MLLPSLQKQLLEVVIRQLCWLRGPRAFEATALLVHASERMTATCEHGPLTHGETHDTCSVLLPRCIAGLAADMRGEVLRPEAIEGVRAATAEGECRAPCILQGCGASQDDQVCPREGIPEFVLNGLQHKQSLVQGSIRWPLPFRGEPEPGTVAAAEPIRRAEGRRAPPSQADEEGAIVGLAVVFVGWQHRGGGLQDFLDRLLNKVKVCKFLRRWRQRVLKRLGLWHVLAYAPRYRAHVAGRELVPSIGERMVERGLVMGEQLHKLLVTALRVVHQRHIAGEHPNLLQQPCSILYAPLPVASRALIFFPLVFQQLLEVDVVPLCGVRRPLELEATREGVLALASAAHAGPRV